MIVPALIASTHGNAALMIPRRYCNGSHARWGRGSWWSNIARRDRACRTSFQGSEIEPRQSDGHGESGFITHGINSAAHGSMSAIGVGLPRCEMESTV